MNMKLTVKEMELLVRALDTDLGRRIDKEECAEITALRKRVDLELYTAGVNATARYGGAVGTNPIVLKQLIDVELPRMSRFLNENSDRFFAEPRVLDFGAGKQALHTSTLRKLGYVVDAYDIGDNFVSGVHTPTLRFKEDTYDVVFASNVLNVQPRTGDIESVILTASACLKSHGVFVCNYPRTPRKSNASNLDVSRLLTAYFNDIHKPAPFLYVCLEPKVIPGITKSRHEEAGEPLTKWDAGGKEEWLETQRAAPVD